MSTAIVKTISLAPETTFEDIFHYVIESFDEYFSDLRADESNKSRDLLIIGKPKMRIYASTLSVHAKVLIQEKERKVKISLEAQNKLNFCFWFTVFYSCIFPVCFLFLIYIHGASKKLIDKGLENAMNRIDAKLSDF